MCLSFFLSFFLFLLTMTRKMMSIRRRLIRSSPSSSALTPWGAARQLLVLLLMHVVVSLEDHHRGGGGGGFVLSKRHHQTAARGGRCVGLERDQVDAIRYLLSRHATRARTSSFSSDARGNFFTRETVERNSTHVTCKSWEYDELRERGLTSVSDVCRKKPRFCTTFGQDEWEKLPSILPGSWGDCAFVGSGNNLLRIPRGNDIDKCDTVFRMSVLPLSPYKEIAGEKNTFVFVRDKRLRKFNYEFRDEDLYGFRASDLENHQKPKALIYDGYRRNLTAGWSLISFGGDLNEPVESLNRDIMNAVKKSRKTYLKGTTGFSLPFTLLFSGYCKSINIFGVSNNAGARYWDGKLWDPRKKVLTDSSEKLREFCKDKRKWPVKMKDAKYKKTGFLKHYCTKDGFHTREQHNTCLETEIWKVLETMHPLVNGVKVKFWP